MTRIFNPLEYSREFLESIEVNETDESVEECFEVSFRDEGGKLKIRLHATQLQYLVWLCMNAHREWHNDGLTALTACGCSSEAIAQMIGSTYPGE